MPTILVAEDDETLRYLLVEALGDLEGWAVAGVADGAALLRTVESLRPDLILLDERMPGLGGTEVYRLLRAREGLGEVPVLFITGAPAQVADAGLGGPHDTLAKPFDLDDLLARVGALLGA